MTPSRVPRLELMENENQNNDYIIFRHSITSKRPKTFKKTIYRKKPRTQRRNYRTQRRKHKKGFFNLF